MFSSKSFKSQFASSQYKTGGCSSYSVEKEEEIRDDNRELVQADYHSASVLNKKRFRSGDIRVSREYTFDNQKFDAQKVVNLFSNKNCRAVSVFKRTKVGANGFMIETAVRLCSHPDISIPPENVLFLTGMSNIEWEKDMREQMPQCYKDNIFHHGKLQHLTAKLRGIKDALLFVDEVDSGDQEGQKLHTLLKTSGLLDLEYMDSQNIRFVFISATIRSEINELNKWGSRHSSIKMTLPSNYVGSKEFLDKGIIQQWYPITKVEHALRWINEDILGNYGLEDPRVNVVRTDEKCINCFREAARLTGCELFIHTSTTRIEDINVVYSDLSVHRILLLKNLYRRANLVPDAHKMKTGAIMEKFTKKVDTNVQIQGILGRHNGYCTELISETHKFGPIRTSLLHIQQYEDYYTDPIGYMGKYDCAAKKPFVKKENIKGLPEEVRLELLRRTTTPNLESDVPNELEITSITKTLRKWCNETNETYAANVLRLFLFNQRVNVVEIRECLERSGCTNTAIYIAQLTTKDVKMYHKIYKKNGNTYSLTDEARRIVDKIME